MASEEELIASVDVLLEEEPDMLPPPAECVRLRVAAGITQGRLASALKTSRQTVSTYEEGWVRPKEPRLSAYRRLLNGWAEKYPAPLSQGQCCCGGESDHPSTLKAERQPG